METKPRQTRLPPAFRRHPRNWRRNRYVYPVCSRRSGGISIGVNLNPGKDCTFSCVYCQVDRAAPPSAGPVDLGVLRAELTEMLALVQTGGLWHEPEFAGLPEHLKRLNDVAFSGDGEPTACPRFAQAVEIADEANAASGSGARLVLITNATLFGRAAVRHGLEILHRHDGEAWCKLETGTEACYRRIARSAVPFVRILRNITWAACRWPIVIQSCFVRLAGTGPDPAELDAYCDRLKEILAAGGRIKLVQVYTIARPPAEPFVTPLPDSEVDSIAQRVQARLPQLPVRSFYGIG